MERARQSQAAVRDGAAAEPGASPGKSSLAEPLGALGKAEGSPGLWERITEGVNSVLHGGHATPFVTHQTRDQAPAGTSDSRLTVGVGELINFKSNMPGTWRATAARAGRPMTGEGDVYQWYAPSVGTQVKVTFTPESGKDPVDMDVTVLAPTLDYKNPKPHSYPTQAAGKAGVGMYTTVAYGPDTVSFSETEWWEQPGPASDPSGYFSGRDDLPFHRPEPDDLAIGERNVSEGWGDVAAFWGPQPPYRLGSFKFTIPTFYRVKGEGVRHKIRDVDQVCTLAADGTMYVTKLGATTSRKP